MVHAGDRTILLDEDGRLALATLTPAGLRVLQQAPITTKLSWTAPTLIGTRLYVRDRKTLRCDRSADGILKREGRGAEAQTSYALSPEP